MQTNVEPTEHRTAHFDRTSGDVERATGRAIA